MFISLIVDEGDRSSELDHLGSDQNWDHVEHLHHLGVSVHDSAFLLFRVCLNLSILCAK